MKSSSIVDAARGEREVLDAALACFVRKGYHGTTIRQIAARAGLSVAGVYHHVSSKAGLLERIIDATMDDLVERTSAARRVAGKTPVEQLDALVRAHVHYHCERQAASFVGNDELRSLEPDALERVLHKRDLQQGFFHAAVRDGVLRDEFHVPDVGQTARAIVTMCTAVARWFRADGRFSAEQIADGYCVLVRQMVGYTEGGTAD